MDQESFAHLVKEALTRLYDHPYLERHPLATALLPEAARQVGALTLHRVLLEVVEALRPPPSVPPSAPSWRPYLVVYRRYVRDMDAAAVAQELAISARQVGREQAKGLETVTGLLWKRYLALREAPVLPGAPSTLETEVSRLGVASAAAVTPLGPAIESVISTLGELAARQQIDIRMVLPAGLPPASLERVVFRQILLNLLAHVLDRADPGAIELAARRSGEGLELEITYCGAAKATAQAIGQNDDRLTLASHLLALQGGRILVTPAGEPAIRLFLPVRQPPTVLVIDDNPEVIELFRRYLSGSTYQVAEAGSGQEALELAPRLRPQVIVLDVMMPAQDGWEVLQGLRNLPATRDIPVIVCTVLRERDLALSLGASGFLTKPVTQEMLLLALAQCTSGPGDAARRARP